MGAKRERLSAQGGDSMYILNSDGSGLRELAVGEYPAWSPVDDWIAHRGCYGADCGLWITHADSGERRRLTTGGGDGQPAWSPNGKQIAYISKDDGNFELYRVNRDGSGKVRLTNDVHSDGLPVWSPDGKWIGFRSDRSGKWVIYVMAADGSNVRKIVDADVLPLWFSRRWPGGRRQIVSALPDARVAFDADRQCRRASGIFARKEPGSLMPVRGSCCSEKLSAGSSATCTARLFQDHQRPLRGQDRVARKTSSRLDKKPRLPQGALMQRHLTLLLASLVSIAVFWLAATVVANAQPAGPAGDSAPPADAPIFSRSQTRAAWKARRAALSVTPERAVRFPAARVAAGQTVYVDINAAGRRWIGGAPVPYHPGGGSERRPATASRCCPARTRARNHSGRCPSLCDGILHEDRIVSSGRRASWSVAVATTLSSMTSPCRVSRSSIARMWTRRSSSATCSSTVAAVRSPHL